ncbi:MAG: PLP-dependent aminotransferase family protein [Clostridia bacterium]|nr:PLP-dependent aminotransferase family protein [Clostridia bacterium]
MTNIAFSDKTKGLSGSAIRATFKLLADPEIISFAGGAPSSSLFPCDVLGTVAEEIFRTFGNTALQYGITEGYAPLRELVRERLVRQGIIHEGDDIAITTGGQQVIDLTAKVLLNEGDCVVTERPSFVGGLNCFRSYNAVIDDVPVESDGMDIDYLEENILKKKRIKLVYTIPTFQNPTGITMSLEKRKKLLNLADRYDFYILEDNPYGSLRYSGEEVPSIKSLDVSGRVIYGGSFSKILSPGLRIGFFSAPSEIFEKMIVCKQVTDVHTPVLTQLIAYTFVTRYDIDAHIKRACELYGKQSSFMRSCISRYFPDYCSVTNPEGGIFLWCSLPERFDGEELFRKAVEKKVAFVSGAACMADPLKKYSSFRLNFSNASMENIEKGIRILGEVIESY